MKYTKNIKIKLHWYTITY